jgi:outer membrane protein
MKNHAIAFIGIFVLGGHAAAQERRLPSVPQTLSVQDAVDLAIRYNPTYQQAANDGGPAAWAVRNAYTAAFLPTLNASSSVRYTGSGEQRFLSTGFRTSSTLGSSYSLNLNWQLNGTSLMEPGRQKAAGAATTANIDATRMSVRNLVVQQYVAVLEAQAQVALQQQQVVRNEENRRLAQARFDVGQNTLLDVRQAEVAKGQSDVALLQAQQTLTVEKLRLFQQMGLEAPTDLSLLTLSDSFPVTEPTWTLEQLLNDADVSNPDVAALRAQETSSRWNERATKSQWLPTLSVFANWSGFTQQFTDVDGYIAGQQAQAANQVTNCIAQNPIYTSAGLPPVDCQGEYGFTAQDEASLRAQNSVFPFDFTRQPFSAGFTLSFPIFDSFNRNLQNSRASAAADDAREARRARELQVRTDVSQQYFGLIAAYQSIQIQQNNRVSAQEGLRLARERYRVGSGTFFELLDAQVTAQQAEATYITAFYAYHRSLANLEAAVGRELR